MVLREQADVLYHVLLIWIVGDCAYTREACLVYEKENLSKKVWCYMFCKAFTGQPQGFEVGI